MVCSVFFNEKVAYDLRNSYWSSDVCASDLSQKEHQAFQRVDVCALYELASAFLGIDHSRLYHDGKVRRKCALRQARSLDELAGRKPVGFMLNQQAEGFEPGRSEEHPSELQSLMRISYAVFCLKKKIEHYINLQSPLPHHHSVR